MSDLKSFFSKHNDLIIWMRKEGDDVIIDIKTQGPAEMVKRKYSEGEKEVKRWKRKESIVKVDSITGKAIKEIVESSVKDIYTQLHPEGSVNL